MFFTRLLGWTEQVRDVAVKVNSAFRNHRSKSFHRSHLFTYKIDLFDGHGSRECITDPMKPRTASSQSPWSPAIETLSIQPSRRTLSAESSDDIKRTHKVPCAKPAGRNIQPGQAVTYTCAGDTKQGACRRHQSGPWTPVRALRALIRQKVSQSSVPYATPAGRNIQPGQAVTYTCAVDTKQGACRRLQIGPWTPVRALRALIRQKASQSSVPYATPAGRNIHSGQAVTYTCAGDTKQGACRRLKSGQWTPVRALRALIRQKVSQSSVPYATPAGRNIHSGQAVTYTCAVDTKQGACRRLQKGPWTPVRALRALIRQKVSQSSVPYATPAGRNIQPGQAVTYTCASDTNKGPADVFKVVHRRQFER